MRVLVCGGRRYNDANRVHAELLSVWIDVLIQGAARGADSLAADYATKHAIPMLPFPAKWHLHGKKAGDIRNAQMLADGKPDLVVAFPGGPGTANMIRQARAAGIEVKEIK